MSRTRTKKEKSLSCHQTTENYAIKRNNTLTYLEDFLQATKKRFKKTVLPFWSEILLELLIKRKYTASQIAYRSGISKTIIHKLLRGTTHHLSHKNFRRLLSLYCRVCYDLKGMKKDDVP